jgi:hypothetical protein
MVHAEDLEVLCNLLRVEELPADVEEEYEIRRKMFHGCGGSGPLQALALISLLRFLGHVPPVAVPPVAVNWREHVGDSISALYGDQRLPGILASLGDGGTLECLLDGVDGVVELPRHAVLLTPCQ